jgi:hypothetical protein
VIIAIHQPQFMPWLGYFDKMDQVDAFVLLDNVQYKKNEFQNRNRIKTPQGPQWLTVPVSYKFPALINEVTVRAGDPWRRKHQQTLVANYAKAPYWAEFSDSLRDLYAVESTSLAEVNRASVAWLQKELGIDTPLVAASEMDLSEEPTQRLLDICSEFGASTYLAGVDGRKYMELDRFEAAGIEVVFQGFEHPNYSQLHGEFTSHLSALDLLFNCGPESGKIVRSNRKK